MSIAADPGVQVNEIWGAALLELEEALSQPTYRTWLQNISPLSLDENKLTIAAPNEFIRDWLERRYSGLIADCATRIVGSPVSVAFVVSPTSSHRPPSPTPTPIATVRPQSARPSPSQTNEFGSLALNPSYTFERFVVGRSNQLSHAAAVSVSKALAGKYNPLFIYGDVGLGKTHLMQAIGHHVRDHYKEANVVYISGETFLYHTVSSIREDRTDAFRRAYRSVDLWLVDDIQYMLHGDRTQIEFFHVFNSLYQTNKQIVICSDRAPKDLALEDRLRSRFEWGLITEIGRPDFEHRIAILQRNAAAQGVASPEAVLNFIAERVTTSVRTLEGVLTHLIAQASLTESPLTLELAQASVEAYTSDRTPARVTLAGIQRSAAEHYGVTIDDMKSQKRNKSVMMPRQVAMFLSRQLTDASLPDIGRAFGGRDHSTVIHSCEKVQKLVAEQADLRDEIDHLREKIAGSDRSPS
ncbi:MAG: chromosomal replication initiator protein DnaA [Armatimonadetes bacterium]|nr:chromosomal replication initiator protein DnaA [Armatimonadota bacterium]NDK10994.1 chromosomal replication initiator protein DnaA [Armatimonadota bacterium]PJB70197.1 MAG: chromosomal replication initiator protein DnaA [Armatimonadetes bacterium CG_4_9_14_3_um_filter_66_14]